MSDLDGGLRYYPTLDAARTEAELRSFLSEPEPENQVLEYKVDLSAKKLAPTIAAFANGYGGYILVGIPEVEDETGRTVPGEPVGLTGNPGSSLRRKCRDSIEPPFTIDVTPIDLDAGGQVLVVRVPALPTLRPVLADRQVWIRDGDQTVAAKRTELQRLCTESAGLLQSPTINPANHASANGFVCDLSDPWLTVRGICGSGPSLGIPLPEIDRSVRLRIVESLHEHPVSGWVDQWSQRWSAQPTEWQVSGATTSATYDTTLVGLTDQVDVVRARLRFAINSPLATMPGVWCVADLSLRAPDATAAGSNAYTWTQAKPASGPFLPFKEFGDCLEVALSAAEHVVAHLALEFDQPRPTTGHLAAGAIGLVAQRVDLTSTGSFSEDPAQRLQHGWQFTEPRVNCVLGEFDAQVVASRLLDRFLLDIGAL